MRGKYMVGLISDEEFEEWIVSQMDQYIKAKLAFGLKRKGFSIKKFLPDFQHTSGRKQIDFKIRKKANDESRHGVDIIKKLIQKDLLGAKINERKIPKDFF